MTSTLNPKPTDKKFTEYKIEFHSRYNGTYMLFGRLSDGKYVLLNETLNGGDVTLWCEAYGCEAPEDFILQFSEEQNKEVLVPNFVECRCC